jgi:hypothetical protein
MKIAFLATGLPPPITEVVIVLERSSQALSLLRGEGKEDGVCQHVRHVKKLRGETVPK